MLDKDQVDVVLVTTVDAHPRRVHRGGAAGRLRRDHREADDRSTRRGAGASSTPQRAHRRHGRGHLQLPVQPGPREGPRAARRAARSARSARCTSSGCSTCATAPTTSAAGTATGPTPAACWCTRRATTSTWSTGGSAPRPVEVYAPGPAVLLRRRGRRRARLRPRLRPGPRRAGRGRRPVRAATWPTTPAARALPRRRDRGRLPARPQRLRPRRDASRTTWRCWCATPPAPR